MNDLAQDRITDSPRASGTRRFPATLGRFDRPAERECVDALVRWVEDTYREEIKARPSKHVYVRHLPQPVVAQIDRLREGAAIRDALARHYDSARWSIEPMQHTDELYLSHYNKDYGGDHGLYGKHYDGNLRFVPFGAVVRALIYLQSDATYTVVFGDSNVRKALVTYDFALLDFHRELHWVEGEYNPNDRQRILLKCNYLVAPKNAVWATRALLAANTGVFYVVKAAMEYSKSPRTPAQRFVGVLCNVMRLANNVHPLVPIGLIVAALAALGWAVAALATAG